MQTDTQRRGPRLSREELRAAAREMRAIAMIDIYAAASGHPGGSLSVMDIAAALYLRVLNHDPTNPEWEERDRVFWSAGHKAPALYVALGRAEVFPLEETVALRRLGSQFEGHPNRLKLPGVEISSGSLGQGLSIAVGSALAARQRGENYRVYCIMGDGEHQERSVWEAVMAAAHYNLDNPCARRPLPFMDCGAPLASRVFLRDSLRLPAVVGRFAFRFYAVIPNPRSARCEVRFLDSGGVHSDSRNGRICCCLCRGRLWSARLVYRPDARGALSLTTTDIKSVRVN